MKVLHITPETDGYEIVELLANSVNKTNHLKVIDINGEQFITGGFILTDNDRIRQVLDSFPKDKQYGFVKEFLICPFEKMYFED